MNRQRKSPFSLVALLALAAAIERDRRPRRHRWRASTSISPTRDEPRGARTSSPSNQGGASPSPDGSGPPDAGGATAAGTAPTAPSNQAAGSGGGSQGGQPSGGQPDPAAGDPGSAEADIGTIPFTSFPITPMVLGDRPAHRGGARSPGDERLAPQSRVRLGPLGPPSARVAHRQIALARLAPGFEVS